MNLLLHGSMGDHLMATGIPEAYYNLMGTRLFVSPWYNPLFWQYNPFISHAPYGESYSLNFNDRPHHYMIYYPVRIFYEMTGHIVDRKLVQPNIYIDRKPQSGMVLINDQAGWPTRRGYPYFDELAQDLLSGGFKVVYLRNDAYRDCNGDFSPQVIRHFSEEIRAPRLPMQHLIDAVRSASLYIGYDSGLSQLAGALKVPYVLLAGSVAPVNTAHDTCIYALECGCHHCNLDNCNLQCLSSSPNKNREIMEAIGENIFKNT